MVMNPTPKGGLYGGFGKGNRRFYPANNGFGFRDDYRHAGHGPQLDGRHNHHGRHPYGGRQVF